MNKAIGILNRLERCLARKREDKEKIFCAYITLGYPRLSFTEKLIPELERAGVDILELGIPFSDPLADGPTIQEASYHALQQKVSIHDAFALMKKMRRKCMDMPVVFFSYYNPIVHYGIKEFAHEVAKSGFDAVLCPDLPPGVDPEFQEELEKYDIPLIYLVAPTTEFSRMQYIAQKSNGFIYYVARRGVTGVRDTLPKDLIRTVRKLKSFTDKSVLVGFGVSDAKQVKEILSVSDGVIVGSALITMMRDASTTKDVIPFVRKLVSVVEGNTPQARKKISPKQKKK